VFWFAGGTDPDRYARAKEAGRLNEFFAVSRMRAQGEKFGHLKFRRITFASSSAGS